MTPRVYFFGDGQSEGDPARRDILGGKGASLAELTRAGLPVPPGFTISVECCESYLGAHGVWPDGLTEEIRAAMDRLEQAFGRKFGQGADPLLVSVRSGAAVSMPGMMDTILNCGLPAESDAAGKDPWDVLIECIEAVFNSWNSPRAIAYRRDRNIRGLSGTAVTVQAMFPSRVSGVAFTENPNDPDAGEIVIEASYGLGEAVVSGEVDPDNFVLDREELTVKRCYIGRKDRAIPAAGDTSEPDPDLPSLTDEQVHEIARIAMGVEELFGFPVDVEWGLSEGRFALLQARGIRPSQTRSRELLLQSVRSALRAEVKAGRGPWVLHNLSETLPHPTPLTWSVQQRFMSGGGGFGAMYKVAGFVPAESVRTRGAVNLIAGKVYMDTSLASELFFENYPFKYDMNLLRWDPDAAQSPPTIPAGTFRSRAAAVRQVVRVDWRLRRMARTLEADLNDRVIPEFASWCRAEKQRPLGDMPDEELVTLWRSREHRVMDEFAPQSLLPSLVSGMALAELRAFIAENFWDVDEDADELAGMLSAPPSPDKTLQANAGLFAIVGGELTVDQWLVEYGHRGPDELDLASPRWRENPGEVAAMARRLAGGQDPIELHHAHVAEIQSRTRALRMRLTGRRRERFDALLGLLRRYIPFREDGKYYLMLGYDLLRDLAVEAGRRLEIGDDVFFLTDRELCDALTSGALPEDRIAQRKEEYRAEARIVLPRVIDYAAIESLDRPPTRDIAESYDAYELSSGVASGPVRIVTSLHDAGELGRGYVLVCRSTDPAWTPLFVNAAGLVLECGGALSHGAIVAREMGIPAVVLPDATNLLQEGQIVAVDGHNGSVGKLDYTGGASEKRGAAADDVRITSTMAPPPRSARERTAARLRNISLLAWGTYLLAAMFWPVEWLYQPSLAMLDKVLWPIAAAWGMPAVVVVVAGSLAALTMIAQWLLVDNRQLREAKRRSAALMREAACLPAGSPRRVALARLTAPVNVRLLAAAMLPISLLLGPMIVTFLWFPVRVDPASWNAAPGTTVRIVASVDCSHRRPVTLQAASPAYLAKGSPTKCKLPPIAEALDQLAAADAPDELWDDVVDSDKSRPELRAALKKHIAAGLPPQNVMWEIKTPPGAEGSFPVTILTRGAKPLELEIVLGNRCPPAPAEVIADTASPIKSARVIYPPSETRRIFWTPLAWFGNNQWDAGWLLTYLLAYLPVMFCLRWILRIA